MSLRVLRSVAAVVSMPVAAVAQTSSMVGYSPGAAAAQRRIEASTIGRPSPDSASELSRVLSREAHVAGTAAQARTRDTVMARMKGWGMETEARAYSVWL